MFCMVHAGTKLVIGWQFRKILGFASHAQATIVSIIQSSSQPSLDSRELRKCSSRFNFAPNEKEYKLQQSLINILAKEMDLAEYHL